MKTTDLSKYDNSWYKPGNFLLRTLWHIVGSILINSNIPFPVSLKISVLKLFGAKIGKGVMIKPQVCIKYPWFLEIGDFVWIGEMVWIDNLTKISLGNHVCLSQGSMLLTGNHDYTKSTFDLKVAEIHLEDGVWIGAKSVVCPGVVAKSHSVLSVNSVATKEMQPYMIYQGNPAKEIRQRHIND
ncbi:WcaF family extracellular polysaccharide biosynthesis acetyltransferase [Arcicella aquatica]|uniref:WcaF family extracellular polysaccharide biosynthesis acetyltransferase n=1 Tax=Arcicella aquatica TaxID=217141 RepID=A0ABU5QQA7_9BACT|nr:WcaF family extracellular polysaccharide biosynthesis acetyltransferase [Arcicella aquatica]MEA5258955.1 WcaF family extracellular polysaccharide biosynthesis acetyltransferase [Arcicella aquatica]